jgi:diguanylate cyclase
MDLVVTDENIIELAAQHLDKALQRLRDLYVPTTPENISIWYHYELADKPRLNQELDRLLARDARFTGELCRQLYQRFFVEHDHQQLELLRQAMKKLIDVLGEQLTTFSQGVDSYADILGACQLQLENSVPDASELKTLVDKLIEETHLVQCTGCSASEKVSALQNEITQLKTSLHELEQTALVDSLTGVGNRRAFDQYLESEIDSAANNGQHCCLLLIDIDHFKVFNDRFGHQVGDRVLKFIANTIKHSVKGRDLVTRYGGEEFAVILPTTEYGGGKAVAEGIVNAVAQTKLTIGGASESGKRDLGKISVSIGMSGFRRGDSVESLFERADKCLYEAKTRGRNTVVADKG